MSDESKRDWRIVLNVVLVFEATTFSGLAGATEGVAFAGCALCALIAGAVVACEVVNVFG